MLVAKGAISWNGPAAPFIALLFVPAQQHRLGFASFHLGLAPWTRSLPLALLSAR